jgi:hypothetical protein
MGETRSKAFCMCVWGGEGVEFWVQESKCVFVNVDKVCFACVHDTVTTAT